MQAASPGTSTTFTASFDQTPADPHKFPNLTLTGPDGSRIGPILGTATSPNTYQVHWYVPTATLLGTWTAQWLLEDDSGGNHTAQSTLLISGDAVADGAPPAYLGELSESTEVVFELPLGSLAQDLQVINVDAVGPGSLSVSASSMTPLNLGDRAGVQMTVGPVGVGVFNLRLRYRETPTGPLRHIVKPLYVLGNNFWRLYPRLIDQLDLLQKQERSPFAYEEYEYAASMVHGVSILNAVQPTTDWTAWNYPQTFDEAVVLGAMITAIRARMIAAKETELSYSGQEISLDVNRGDAYQGILSDLQDRLQDFREAKQEWHLNSRERVVLAATLGASPRFGIGRGYQGNGFTASTGSVRRRRRSGRRRRR